MKYIPISIPIKPYLKKYIHSLYGQVVVVSFKTFVGMNIYCLLERKGNEKKDAKTANQLRYRTLTDKLTIILPKDLYYRVGHVIPEDKAIVINIMYEQYLSEHLSIFCDAYKKAGRQKKEAIEDFCARFNIDIDIDITMEALRKLGIRRNSKEKKVKKSMAEMSHGELPFFFH